MLVAIAPSSVEPRQRWRAQLLRAFAAFRRGDRAAGAMAAAAFEVAARRGEGGPCPDGAGDRDALQEVGRDAGRNRLRTVRNRVRSVAGEVLVRDGEVIALAPGDDPRLLRGARALCDQGRPGEALAAPARARKAFAELGMAVPSALVELEALVPSRAPDGSLARRPGTAIGTGGSGRAAAPGRDPEHRSGPPGAADV